MLSTASSWTELVAARPGVSLQAVTQLEEMAAMKHLLGRVLGQGDTIADLLADGKAFIAPETPSLIEAGAAQHLAQLGAVEACLAVLKSAVQEPAGTSHADDWQPLLKRYCEVGACSSIRCCQQLAARTPSLSCLC